MIRHGTVAGMGNNDINEPAYHIVDGEVVINPLLASWNRMLARCYNGGTQERQPTYKGCTVADEWLKLSRFKEWMMEQDWEGKHLDKDLLVKGNTLYSKDTCLFITPRVNTLITSKSRAGKLYPTGVTKAQSGNFLAQCCSYEKVNTHLGTFGTPQAAHREYCNYKAKVFLQVAIDEQDVRVKQALLQISLDLLVSAKEYPDGYSVD